MQDTIMLEVQLDDGTSLVIPEDEISFSASRGSGPGGQHVNVTASRVTVRFNVLHSAVLDRRQKERIASRLASRISSAGELAVSCADGRSQHANRRTALQRLAALLTHALHTPRPRTKTKTPAAQKRKRLDDKKKRALTKRNRRSISDI
jgi:ribosome-associated protein